VNTLQPLASDSDNLKDMPIDMAGSDQPHGPLYHCFESLCLATSWVKKSNFLHNFASATDGQCADSTNMNINGDGSVQTKRIAMPGRAREAHYQQLMTKIPLKVCWRT
jgi:hypothetical protein